MPKYDAFGREIGENTLAGLGGTSEASVRPAPSEPADAFTEAPAPELPEPPVVRIPDAGPTPRRVRSARPLGCLVGLLIVGAIVVGPIIAVVSFVDSASDTIDDVTSALDGAPTIDAPETPAASPPPSGIAGKSMVAPDNVARVLKELRSDGVKSVVRLVVRTDRTDAEAITGGRTRVVTFHAEGGVERDAARPVNPAQGSIRVAAINPDAPARLVRNAAERYPVRERGINYLIASPDDGGHRWVAYFKNGVYVEGDERGRVIRRIS